MSASLSCHISKSVSFQKTALVSTIPGDKSISHRAAIIGALADNKSIFKNMLVSEDCLNTVTILKQCGVPITINDTILTVEGVGLYGLKAPSSSLDVGNSGTSIRLLSGLFAGQPFETVLTGDASIQKRPMKRVVEPLTEMGAVLSGQSLPGKNDIYPPLTIQGKRPLKAIHHTLKVASAQVKSALLLASLYADGTSEITEPQPCRDHTERMLKGFGADIHFGTLKVLCSGKKSLHNPYFEPILIPSDLSSAAFFIVLAAVTPGATFTLSNIGINPTRFALVNVLQQMGASIEISNVHGNDFEPYATLTVKGSKLTNLHVPEALIPYLIDEIPILAVAALFAQGTFTVTGAKELRVKESDRIEGIARIVKGFGGDIKTTEDGFSVKGPIKAASVNVASEGDHRIAMSAIIGAIASQTEATIEDCACIRTSFPNFFEVLNHLECHPTLKGETV